MNIESTHTTGPFGGRKRTSILAAVVGGLAQVTVGFFTITAIGLLSVPLWAAVVLGTAWLVAAAVFVLAIRPNPVLAVLAPVVNGLVLWGVVAAGEAWLGWTG